MQLRYATSVDATLFGFSDFEFTPSAEPVTSIDQFDDDEILIGTSGSIQFDFQVDYSGSVPGIVTPQGFPI